MLKIFDKLLSKLPANGWKTWLGFLTLVVAHKLPLHGGGMEAVQAILEQLGIAYGSIGAVHKIIKEIK